MTVLTSGFLLKIITATAALMYLIYKYFTSHFDYWQKRGVQHIKPTPIFGNFREILTLKTPIGHFLGNLYNQREGDYFGIWVFRTPHLLIRSPELIKNILVKDFNHFSDRTVVDDEKADPIVSRALFVVKNPDWKVLRAKFSPIFTSGKIKAMIPLMNDGAEEMKVYLNKIILQEKSIEVKELCAKFTTNIITSCAFGVNAESFKHENAEFREIGRKMFDFNLSNAFRQTSYFFAPILVKWFRLTFFVPEVNQFCKSAILETIKERENNGGRRNDLIDIIIELKKAGTFDGLDNYDDSIVAQGVQFFAAGFETTSSTMALTLYEMCINPTIQSRLRKEINAALVEHETVTYETINSIKYLDLVIKETLRKYPLLPFLDRRCIKDYQIPDTDTIIEKGTPIFIPVWGLHHDPKYFPEPERFDPERFTEEKQKTRPAYSYLPFGEGPRNCIGARFGLIASKLGIIHILSNFIVERSEETPVPIVFDPKSIILQSTVGLPMRFTYYNKTVPFVE